MKTQVTLLIVKILLQPSVALEVDKDCLMPWQPLSVNPAALYLQGLEANPFEKGPQMPLEAWSLTFLSISLGLSSLMALAPSMVQVKNLKCCL